MPISLTQLAFEQAHEPQRFQDLVFAEPLVREQLQGYANRSCWNHLLLHGSYCSAAIRVRAPGDQDEKHLHGAVGRA